MAITGHKTTQEIDRYIKAAKQKGLSREAKGFGRESDGGSDRQELQSRTFRRPPAPLATF